MAAPKIELRKKKRAKGKILTGMNCEVYVDGKKLRGVTGYNLEINANGVAKVTLEMVGDISVITESETP